MGKAANFEIVFDRPRSFLVIQDIGPWDEHLTITNDAESVVERLKDRLGGRSLLYIDSEGELAELCYDHAFTKFKPLDKKTQEALLDLFFTAEAVARFRKNKEALNGEEESP